MGLRPRIIPILLLHQNGIYKTKQFKRPSYIGDPLNVVRIFNDMEVDELFLLDIDASKEGKDPDYKRLVDITGEAFMPVAYGGGIQNIEQVKELFSTGIEKIVLNSVLSTNIDFIEILVATYGSQCIVANIDYKRTFFSTKVYFYGGRQKSRYTPVEWALKLAQCGVGEILLNNIDREGLGQGYDLSLLKKISAAVDVPVIISGGASSTIDFKKAHKAGASGFAAGSMFVYKQPHRAVLINYPSADVIEKMIHDD